MPGHIAPHRNLIIGLTALAAVCGVFCLAPIPQDLAYHNFADKRGALGVPNFGDVMGNALYLVMGVIGLMAARAKAGADRLLWMTFFAGVTLTAFGSGYYHLAPDNHTLVWDRLPMTIAFMSLFSLIIRERVDRRMGLLLFPLLLAAGAFSVWYWDYTESQGMGDLRPYALVQFLPMVEILLILALFPARHFATKYLMITFAGYVAAKVFEHFDHGIFNLLGQAVSGHTLKHIISAIGLWWAIKYMKAVP